MDTDETVSGALALVEVAGLPIEALDALWSVGLVGTSRAYPPSDDVAADLIATSTTTPVHEALARSLRSATLLNDLVARHPTVTEIAVRNPHFNGPTPNTVTFDTWEVSREQADGQWQTEPQPYKAAWLIIRAGHSALTATLLDGRLAGTLPAAQHEIADILHSELFANGTHPSGEQADPNAAECRRLRTATLPLVDAATAREALIALHGHAGNNLTADDIIASLPLIAGGVIAPDGMAAGMAPDGLAYLRACDNGPAATLLERFTADVKSRVAVTRKVDTRTVSHDMSESEATLFELEGDFEAAARIRLSGTGKKPFEETLELLEMADVETIVDWAEKRLPQRPGRYDVVKAMTHLGGLHAMELAEEMQHRPDPLVQNPELVVILPDPASPVTIEAVRFLAEYLIRELTGEDQWKALAALLLSGNGGTAIELASTVRLLNEDS